MMEDFVNEAPYPVPSAPPVTGAGEAATASPTRPGHFGPLRGLAVIGVFIGAQLVVGVAVALLWAVGVGTVAGVTGRSSSSMLSGGSIWTFTILLGGVGGYVGGIAAAWAWGKRILGDEWMPRFGLTRPRIVDCGVGLALGLALGCLYALVAVLMTSNKAVTTNVGPVARLASTPGFARLAWLVLALMLAPCSEELLFRGVLFSSFATRWTPFLSAAASIGIFVAFHLSEATAFWPAVIAISLLGVGTTTLRTRSGGIFPGVAMHLAYNGVIAVVSRMPSL